MPTVAPELLVFVSSPGDCDAERKLVRSVADEVTQALGYELAVRIRVTGWEDVPPDLGRPQGQINPLVDECDIFVGILGHRWGSPTGTHPSGFLEEFERVVERRGDSDHPHIALYFRTVPSPMAADPGPQLKTVLDFQQRLRDENFALYRSFDGPDDLVPQLWALFVRLMARATSAANQEAAEGTSAGTATAAPEAAPATDLATDEMDEARRQITATTDAVTQVVRGSRLETSIDNDRFLLFALALNKDAGPIPTHVANRLYRRRGELALSPIERQLWLRTVVADIGRSSTPARRVVPGWALLILDEGELVGLLSDDDDHIPVGVFRILLRLKRRPDDLWNVEDHSHSEVAARWAAALRRSPVADAAVEYLAALAQPADVPLLDAILKMEDSASLSELRALLVGDTSPMANSVSSSYSPPQWKAAAVLAAISAADDAAIRAIATSGRVSAELRRAAFSELEARHLVDDELLKVAITLPGMADAVLASAADPESPISIETVASIVANLDSNATNRSELKARVMASTSTLGELLSLLDRPGFSLDAWDALSWKGDQDLIERARSIFDTDAEELVAPLLDNEDWRDNPRVLLFVRAKARLAALRILTASTTVEEEDRSRVRAEVARDDVYTRDEAFVMLASIATAADVAEMLARLPHIYGADRREVVEAILGVGGTDAARQLIESGEAVDVVSAIPVLGADPAVGNDELRELLYSPQDEVRIAALEQLAKRLSADSLRTLLDEYPAQRRSYYYNVAAELDWLLYTGPGPNQEPASVS